MPTPAEHDAFARLTTHLTQAVEQLQTIAALRPDQNWPAVVNAMKILNGKIYNLADRGAQVRQ